MRVNPFMPDVAFLYNADNGFAGIIHADHNTCRLDSERLEEQFKTKQKVVSQFTREARQLAAPLTAKTVAVTANNAQVITDHQRQQLTAAAREAKAQTDLARSLFKP